MNKVIVTKNVEGHGKPISNSAVFSTRFKFKPFTSEESFRCIVGNMGEPTEECAVISKLPGIERISNYESGDSYDVTVRKGTAFSWEELEPEIVKILESRHDRLSQ